MAARENLYLSAVFPMYIKIYFNNKPLFLCDELNEEINNYAHHDDAVFIDDFSAPSVNSIIHEMRTENVHAGIFFYTDLEALNNQIAFVLDEDHSVLSGRDSQRRAIEDRQIVGVILKGNVTTRR